MCGVCDTAGSCGCQKHSQTLDDAACVSSCVSAWVGVRTPPVHTHFIGEQSRVFRLQVWVPAAAESESADQRRGAAGAAPQHRGRLPRGGGGGRRGAGPRRPGGAAPPRRGPRREGRRRHANAGGCSLYPLHPLRHLLPSVVSHQRREGVRSHQPLGS